ncbi:hypothetical protein QKM20_gp4 [Epiphyllum badnavirus 1]|uniref:Uncharacterized protein n=1 Tax=Epiphyllum badnavirus 1 TaxID=2518008 RepID=A0A411HE39_9VIRU|nr:hypothetical protein QKM20_gp4 [Epiphyllum badnavirus 1]QBB68761.1 hypothetical protein [Epiphyllum badnavirus 1]
MSGAGPSSRPSSTPRDEGVGTRRGVFLLSTTDLSAGHTLGVRTLRSIRACCCAPGPRNLRASEDLDSAAAGIIAAQKEQAQQGLKALEAMLDLEFAYCTLNATRDNAYEDRRLNLSRQIGFLREAQESLGRLG